MIKFLRKYHKWLGIIWALFFIIFAFSGIVLNHRKLFAPLTIKRSFLPKIYRYHNWNLAAVRSTLPLSKDSILIYGNIGIWLTDSTFSGFKDFNQGLPSGMDNRKIAVIKQINNDLLAGTLFGLYKYDFISQRWNKISLPLKNSRIVDITKFRNKILIITRSNILQTDDLKHFKIITLKPPQGYDNKIGLFKTLWVIHSGEIYGSIGKLIVDLVGIIFTFLTITGLIIWLNKTKIAKNNSIKTQRYVKSVLRNRYWHNTIGWISIIFLLITATTGMFLRPPFLLFIAQGRVNKLPHTELDTPNAWYEKLWSALYDDQRDILLLGTDEGIFYLNNLDAIPKSFDIQPPLSVMGINVFRKQTEDTYLVGSFEGIYLWNPYQGYVVDLLPKKDTSPRGDAHYSIAGYTDDYPGGTIAFDYDLGAINITGTKSFIPMPQQIKSLPMSLWRVAQEFHTARIFRPILGGFYILIVPLTGLIAIFILLSGFWVWFKIFRENNNKQYKI